MAGAGAGAGAGEAGAELALPAAPRGLCFDRLDFVKSNFSVDNFLAEHQNVASLETMRDDLGAYLKVLRLAMIELINKDYANFVNLSATLIGFDKAIQKIEVPLGQLKEEVLNVKQCLEEAMRELSIWLNQENTLRQKKLTLKYYSQTLSSFKSLSNILKLLDGQTAQETSTQVDRAVMQYNQLQFTISKCGSLIKSEEQTLFSEFGEKLTQTLNDLLFLYWRSGDEDGLLRTLLTLAALNKISETETLLRRQAIAPSLQDIITESNLQRSSNGLQAIYDKILALLDNEFKLLLVVTQHSKLSFLVNSYKFLLNCFWNEVESRLEIHLASIFAPGNPKVFYSRYSDSMHFIRKLERYCHEKETVRMLHETKEYKSFERRWNLPVYFQIRFQEIAGEFESSLTNSPTLDIKEFYLKETQLCWKALNDCWSDGIFIEALTHKYWKLSLQLISRYVTWVTACCDNKPSLQPASEYTINNLLVKNSIYIYLDVNKMLDHLPNFLLTVKSKIHIQNTDILDQSLKISEVSLIGTRTKIKQSIVNEMFGYYSGQLKQVSDIPRLYRKTNRSVPTRPCNYIENVSKAVGDFKEEFKSLVDEAFLLELLRELFAMTTNSYCKSVDDVLTSVQKTEDSLRRLKQIRDKSSPQTNESTGISDGDKIRLQLNVDVSAYRGVVEQALGNVNSIGAFEDLETLVTEAVKDIDIK